MIRTASVGGIGCKVRPVPPSRIQEARRERNYNQLTVDESHDGSHIGGFLMKFSLLRFVLTFLTGVMLIAISLYGRPGYHTFRDDNRFSKEKEVQNFNHGWPLPFLRRNAGRGDYDSGTLPYYDSDNRWQRTAHRFNKKSSPWPIDDADWVIFSGWKLALNIGASILVCGSMWFVLGAFAKLARHDSRKQPAVSE